MLITFEGTDGAGKTTQVQRLAQTLEQNGYTVFTTREPGGTSIGNQIRDVLHNIDNTDMHAHAEVLLYNASRAQLVAQVLRPRLAVGEVILCDRFYDSTLAYQGYGHGLAVDALQAIIRFATGGLEPDLTLYFELSAEDGIQRRQADAAKGGELNRMDLHKQQFYERVVNGYNKLRQAQPHRWHTIDASQSIEHIQHNIEQLVLAKLKGDV